MNLVWRTTEIVREFGYVFVIRTDELQGLSDTVIDHNEGFRAQERRLARACVSRFGPSRSSRANSTSSSGSAAIRRSRGIR
jgi:hypothetical protein